MNIKHIKAVHLFLIANNRFFPELYQQTIGEGIRSKRRGMGVVLFQSA